MALGIALGVTLGAAAGACGRGRPRGDLAASGGRFGGTDAVVLRVPHAGGRMSAAVYPRLDSVVWRSREAVPALARVLAFDGAAGQLAGVDAAGRATRVDLRLGTAQPASRVPLGGAVASGATFFGVANDGAVTRLTAAGGEWRVRLPVAPQGLYPQRDGSVIAAAARGGTGRVWVLRPPAAAAAESASVPGATAPIATGAGDAVYFAGGDELLGVRTRGLRAVAPVGVGAAVRQAVATPSGDRLYVLTARAAELRVVDRYAGRVAGTVALPGAARDLRMDPLGRYLLVRVAAADSVWVVALGTERVVGGVRSTWRADLPLVFPDGSIAVADGADVAIRDGETLRSRQTVIGGAADLWHVVMWNGFRPSVPAVPAVLAREAAPAQQADDDAADTTAAPADSAAAPPDSASAQPESAAVHVVSRPRGLTDGASGEVRLTPVRLTRALTRDLTRDLTARLTPASQPPAPVRGPRPARATAGRVYTVQFAAAPTEREALGALRRLQLPAPGGRVVPRTVGGQTVFRVVAGPFASRADAEQVGRAAGGRAWVYAGSP